jgi:predicted ATP-dependent endonuclease of OLD family
VRIEGGVLDGFDRRFDAQLNVLIGGRGTGKSSVIELIRFCLGATSYSTSAEQVSMEHALGVLGDGRVTVILRDGTQRIEVSRTAADTEPESEVDFEAPFVFSQSEIETIGLQAQSRLRLIDDFLPRDNAAERSGAGSEARIRSMTAEIHSLLNELDDIKEKTAALPKLQEQLKETKKQAAVQSGVVKEIAEHRAALNELTPTLAAARVRAEAIGRATDRLSAWSEQLVTHLDAAPTIEAWPEQAGPPDELAELRRKHKQALGRMRDAFSEISAVTNELARKRTAATSQKVGLENRARDIRQKIEAKQKGASAIDKRASDLAQQISVLKSLLDLAQQRQSRLEQLRANRSRLIDQMARARQARTTRREETAEGLSNALGPVIRVSIKPYSQYRDYVSTLAAALRGSGLRYSELSERIAKVFSPQEIAVLAESRDVETIAATLEVAEDRGLRICDALRGDAAAALFTTDVEDDVDIELMDGNDFKSVGFLSMGQRCTAVLPIILRHVDRIIILDQPEDHLDNAFVVGTLVKAIGARTKGAQTIVATHNPNIPVLGEAEAVIHLDSDGSRCFVRAAGSLDAPRIVDAITTIMEGGREAFKRRADFYARNQPHGPKR